MMTLPLASTSTPLSILCLGAHCDDIELGCGGTLVELSRTREVRVTWVVLASDEVREAECRACAKALLGDRCELVFKRHRDGFLPYLGEAVKDDFEAVKSTVDPDVIFTHARHDLHQDHRLVSELTWNTFRDHLVLEYEIPKYDGDLGNPNAYFPLSEDAVRLKTDALLQSYASQRGKRWFEESLFRSLLRLRGMECNAPSGLAEAYLARKVRLHP